MTMISVINLSFLFICQEECRHRNCMGSSWVTGKEDSVLTQSGVLSIIIGIELFSNTNKKRGKKKVIILMH